jgi:chromosome segregation ATPase
VRLTVNGQTYSAPFEIRKDPRLAATREDLDAQFELLLQIRDKLSQTHAAVLRLRDIRAQVDEWLRRAEGSADRRALQDAAKRLKERLAAIEEELVQPRATGESDRLNYPGRLNVKLVHLAAVVASADAVPTRQSSAVFQHLSSQIDAQLAELDHVVATDVPTFSDRLRKAAVPAIVATTPATGR